MEEIAVKSFKHNIKDELGLHARPASVLATEAKKYSSKITVTANDKTVDGASMIGLMTMALKHGQEITINIEGDDDNAYAGLQALCQESVNSNIYQPKSYVSLYASIVKCVAFVYCKLYNFKLQGLIY